jgi:hypothetical protein
MALSKLKLCCSDIYCTITATYTPLQETDTILGDLQLVVVHTSHYQDLPLLSLKDSIIVNFFRWMLETARDKHFDSYPHRWSDD